MCNIDWDGHAEFWHDARRRARKQHRCTTCSTTIAPGETYVRHASKCEGMLTSERMCLACDALMDEFCAVDGHPRRTTPSSLQDYISSCLDGDDENEIYDEAADEFRPGPEAVRWQEMLREISDRRAAAGVSRG